MLCIVYAEYFAYVYTYIYMHTFSSRATLSYGKNINNNSNVSWQWRVTKSRLKMEATQPGCVSYIHKLLNSLWLLHCTRA